MTQEDCTDCAGFGYSLYSIDSIANRLAALGLPFADHFARALVGLIAGGRISLQRVAEKMPGYHDAEANRQQLRRCLDHETLVPEAWALAIATLLPRHDWVLALDRTEWKRGDTTINLLVLAVVVHQCAVPLLWTVMPACGASDTKERIDLLQRFEALFGRKRLRFLTADREFIGGDWIEWLLRRKLPFRIRIKANTLLWHADGDGKTAFKWFEKRANRCAAQPMEVWGMQLFVGGKRLTTVDDKGRTEYLIVISNEKSDDLWQDYRLRWKIETLFQALKGRGFDLESSRLSKENRLSNWFGFLALGFCWCLNIGQQLDQSKPLPLKNHGRRAISVFQRGLRYLQPLIDYLAGRPNYDRFIDCLNLLSPNNSHA